LSNWRVGSHTGFNSAAAQEKNTQSALFFSGGPRESFVLFSLLSDLAVIRANKRGILLQKKRRVFFFFTYPTVRLAIAAVNNAKQFVEQARGGGINIYDNQVLEELLPGPLISLRRGEIPEGNASPCSEHNSDFHNDLSPVEDESILPSILNATRTPSVSIAHTLFDPEAQHDATQL